MKKLIFIIVFLLMTAVSAEAAKPMSTQGLLKNCGAKFLSIPMGICLGYIRGFLEYHQLMQDFEIYEVDHRIPKSCIPEALEVRDFRGMIINHARLRPELIRESPIALMVGTIYTMWPCEKKDIAVK